ncbi:hypothetical protein I4F81_005421 [Pyropia yezoensis]|uniref:Uncharacterized protein n=1 Tax=Pyropia yezoensis TaxID=2788 RepID=A0ACC3BYS7_PYRYE|nr:hypothetical protein I4F81_005421 [Neopyropia yezoensis]
MAAPPPPPPAVTAEALFPAVAAALSADGPTRRGAEAALRTAEPTDGYLGSLVTITASPGAAPTDVRWLSAVLVKNAVPRLWRRRPAAGGLAEEEKAYVRATLLGAHGETDPRVAVQVSLAVARIARLDAPRAWPELLPALMAAAGGAVGEGGAGNTPAAADGRGAGGGGGGDAAARSVGVHAMATLGHVLREMASRRLAADRRALAAAAPDILGALLAIWEATLGRLVGTLQAATGVGGDGAAGGGAAAAATAAGGATPLASAIAHDLRVVSLCFKCVRRLVEHAVDSLDAVPAAGTLFSRLLGHRALFFTPYPGVGAAAATAAAAGAPPGWAPLEALTGGAKALPIDAAAAALQAGVAAPVAAFVTGRLSELAAKLVVAAQVAHPVSFGPFLPPFLDAYTGVVVAHEGGVGGGGARAPHDGSAAGADAGADAATHTALAFWATSFLRNVATSDTYAKAGGGGGGVGPAGARALPTPPPSTRRWRTLQARPRLVAAAAAAAAAVAMAAAVGAVATATRPRRRRRQPPPPRQRRWPPSFPTPPARPWRAPSSLASSPCPLLRCWTGRMTPRRRRGTKTAPAGRGTPSAPRGRRCWWPSWSGLAWRWRRSSATRRRRLPPPPPPWRRGVARRPCAPATGAPTTRCSGRWGWGCGSWPRRWTSARSSARSCCPCWRHRRRRRPARPSPPPRTPTASSAAVRRGCSAPPCRCSTPPPGRRPTRCWCPWWAAGPTRRCGWPPPGRSRRSLRTCRCGRPSGRPTCPPPLAASSASLRTWRSMSPTRRADCYRRRPRLSSGRPRGCRWPSSTRSPTRWRRCGGAPPPRRAAAATARRTCCAWRWWCCSSGWSRRSGPRR